MPRKKTEGFHENYAKTRKYAVLGQCLGTKAWFVQEKTKEEKRGKKKREFSRQSQGAPFPWDGGPD